jgi:hypothetical protein
MFLKRGKDRVLKKQGTKGKGREATHRPGTNECEVVVSTTTTQFYTINHLQ